MLRLLCFFTISLFTTGILAEDRVENFDPSKIEKITMDPLLIRADRVDDTASATQQSGPAGSESAEVTCLGQWQGGAAAYVPNWFYGGEFYAVYQDPEETGCVPAYPLDINYVSFHIYAQSAASMDVVPMIYDYAGADAFGPILCTGPTYSLSFPNAGSYIVGLPISCVVAGPYYAAVEFQTYLGPGVLDIVVDNGTTVPPRSDACYNDWGGGWQDLVDDQGFSWNLMLYSQGESLFGSGCTTANCVEIPSITVPANAQDVEIPILIHNDAELKALVVPFTLETVSGSASITSARLEYRERLAGGALSDLHVCQQYGVEDGTCKQGSPGGYGTVIGSTCGVDFAVASMPEGFLFACQTFGSSTLLPGSDAVGSIVLVVDIGPGVGTMIVDTTCVDPANHLWFLDNTGQAVTGLSFSGGKITVIDACCGLYDPNNRTGNVDQDPGNVKDLTDILLLASYAFLSGDPPPCMAEMNVSGDAGCVYDLSDVLALASYSFLSGDPPAYCLPECE